MSAIRYRWDSYRFRFVVEAVAEQPDGTTAVHTLSKHETEHDAQQAALLARQERDEVKA